VLTTHPEVQSVSDDGVAPTDAQEYKVPEAKPQDEGKAEPQISLQSEQVQGLTAATMGEAQMSETKVLTVQPSVHTVEGVGSAPTSEQV
jgi:hypothetical protein